MSKMPKLRAMPIVLRSYAQHEPRARVVPTQLKIFHALPCLGHAKRSCSSPSNNNTVQIPALIEPSDVELYIP